VPVVQQEALQELARAIVREAGISREDVGRLDNGDCEVIVGLPRVEQI
jgi:hypothetical protein